MRLKTPSLTLLLALAASALTAQEPPVTNARIETASAAAGLEAAVRQAGGRGQEPVWVGWSVPMIFKERYLCCLGQVGRKNWTQTTCHLEGRNQSWGSTDDVKVPADQDLLVLVRLRGQEIDEVRSYSESCSIDADGRRFVWLGDVKPEESVALLAKLARSGETRTKSRDFPENALAALSHHRNARADDVLEDLASAPHSEDMREHALFWIGQNRGERGAKFLTKVMTGDPDEDIRGKAIFSLSQSEVPGVADAIIAVSRNDRSGEVRGEALFWLAQMGDAKAPDAILQAIDRDPEVEVKKKGVFALTQLPKGRGIPILVRLGREGKPREIRKEALFWLAQSDDPAAMQYLDKVLNE
ncbi:MAG TPA: HEAT repeat domain-containing protein [Thermoanaerobaculia bacterium]|nr:HEAT repeat domain-containing protein [Thermoanaerobaculia bacterium]